MSLLNRRKTILPNPRKKSKGKLAFVDGICDSVKRGDIDYLIESMKLYWEDKRNNPWHRIDKLLEKYWDKEKTTEDISETMILIRDAVFASLDIHCLSLAIDESSFRILSILTKAKSWKAGRQDVRNTVSDAAEKLIKQRSLDYLESSALKRDNFGYLVPQLEEAKIEQFGKAKPEVKNDKLDISKLHKTVIGRRVLRERQLTEKTIPMDDSRAKELEQNYENILLELEIDSTRIDELTGLTEQLTLDGKTLDEEETTPKETETKKKDDDSQATLTEFIPDKKKRKKKTSPKKSSRERMKARRSKKKATKGGEK